MNTTKHWAVAVGLLAMTALVTPANASAQRSGVEVWANVCGRCHTIQPPNRYTAKDWQSILTHMTVNARLTGAQKDAILAFLQQGARRLADAGQSPAQVAERSTDGLVHASIVTSDPQSAEDQFKSLCAPCHGNQGKGDGPAAVGFNPKPADFTKAELWTDRTDEELIASVTNGVRMMPAFGSQLTPDQIKALVGYIRGLSGTKSTALRRSTP